MCVTPWLSNKTMPETTYRALLTFVCLGGLADEDRIVLLRHDRLLRFHGVPN